MYNKKKKEKWDTHKECVKQTKLQMVMGKAIYNTKVIYLLFQYSPSFYNLFFKVKKGILFWEWLLFKKDILFSEWLCILANFQILERGTNESNSLKKTGLPNRFLKKKRVTHSKITLFFASKWGIVPPKDRQLASYAFVYNFQTSILLITRKQIAWCWWTEDNEIKAHQTPCHTSIPLSWF